MMTKKLIAFALLIFSEIFFAQVKKDSLEIEKTYEQLMQENLALLPNSKTEEDLDRVYQSFIKIGDKERKEWLPYYYASYAKIIHGKNLVKDKKGDEELITTLDFAQKALNKSMLINENVENWVLQKLIYQLEYYEKPVTEYQKGGALALQALSQAEKLDSRNPRVALLKSEDLYFSPKNKGGDKVKGMDFYKKTLKLFNSYKSKIQFYPTWGAEEVEAMIEKGVK